ncbi:centromere protein M-like [Patiria miniata]|uniref:Centromere protein M n=1 Tax=Patiria miniata TaxID=46514 RepID=A0A914AL88_PATMI|nr:centromere protein M-like [Patiria miniata]
MAFTSHSKLPELNTATILLVGMQGIGKHRLAGALLELNTSYSLQVRTATHLPLPAENSESRPRIDFVVFLLDANNNMSISKTVASAKELDVSYFLGRACFVVLNATSESLHCTDMSNITGLCDAHDSPMLCGSLQDENQRKCLARKLLCQTEVSSGFKHAVSPMLIQATKHTYEFMEPL